MQHDYSLLIENLKGRRYDEALREHALTDSFHASEYSDCIKYTLECMVEIDPAYAYKVYANSRKIHENISKSLKKRGYHHIDYRYQGALKTYSNILLYGDVEIIVIQKNISDKPHSDVKRLSMELMDTLSGDPSFKSVDYSDKTRIRITALKPTCEIDILPSVWVDSAEYLKTRNEIYRGIAEFDFVNRRVKKYLPFLNIARINARDQHTKGNLKSLCRLLKSLQADSSEKIDLKDSEINAIVYSMPEENLYVDPNLILSVLPKLSEMLNQLSTHSSFFEQTFSPSGKDRVFAGKPEKQKEILKLARSLKQLIEDLTSDLATSGKTLSSPIAYRD